MRPTTDCLPSTGDNKGIPPYLGHRPYTVLQCLNPGGPRSCCQWCLRRNGAKVPLNHQVTLWAPLWLLKRSSVRAMVSPLCLDIRGSNSSLRGGGIGAGWEISPLFSQLLGQRPTGLNTSSITTGCVSPGQVAAPL